LKLVAVGASAAVYLAVLRGLGLDPEERHVWNRIKARILEGRKGRSVG
jgi:hypothetical protein